MKTIASHLAIVYEAPEIKPKPKIPATTAMRKNNTAKNNQPDKPFLFIL